MAEIMGGGGRRGGAELHKMLRVAGGRFAYTKGNYIRFL